MKHEENLIQLIRNLEISSQSSLSHTDVATTIKRVAEQTDFMASLPAVACEALWTDVLSKISFPLPTSDDPESTHQLVMETVLRKICKNSKYRFFNNKYITTENVKYRPDASFTVKEDLHLSWFNLVFCAELQKTLEADSEYNEALSQAFTYCGRAAKHQLSRKIFFGIMTSLRHIQIFKQTFDFTEDHKEKIELSHIESLLENGGEPTEGFKNLCKLLYCSPEHLGFRPSVPQAVTIKDEVIEIQRCIGRSGNTRVYSVFYDDEPAVVKIGSNQIEVEAEILTKMAAVGLPVPNLVWASHDTLVTRPVGIPLCNCEEFTSNGFICCETAFKYVTKIIQQLQMIHEGKIFIQYY